MNFLIGLTVVVFIFWLLWRVFCRIMDWCDKESDKFTAERNAISEQKEQRLFNQRMDNYRHRND